MTHIQPLQRYKVGELDRNGKLRKKNSWHPGHFGDFRDKNGYLYPPIIRRKG